MRYWLYRQIQSNSCSEQRRGVKSSNSLAGGDLTNLGLHTPLVLLSFSFFLGKRDILSSYKHYCGTPGYTVVYESFFISGSFFHIGNKNILPPIPPQMHVSVYYHELFFWKKRKAVTVHFSTLH